jgi:hypothetical protein
MNLTCVQITIQAGVEDVRLRRWLCGKAAKV